MRALIAAVLILVTPTYDFAWGQTGHRVTGAIAEPLLSRRAAREVRAIIGNESLAVGNGADRGGNDVQVTFFGDRTNLHAVWDSGLIDRRQLSYTEWADWLQRRITPSLRREWSNPDPLVWVAESAAIRDAIYPEGDSLSYDCVFAHRESVDR